MRIKRVSSIPRHFFLVLILTVTAFTQQPKPLPPAPLHQHSLKGLPGVYVEVLPILSQIKLKDISEKELRSHIEERLRDAGIKVLSGQESVSTAGRPRLQVVVGVFELPRCGLFHEVNLKLTQEVLLIDGNTKVEAVTWESAPSIGQTTEAGNPNPADGIETMLEKRLRSFIDSYRDANGK